MAKPKKDTIVLEFKDGSTEECLMCGLFDYNSEQYMILTYRNRPQDMSLLIYKYVENKANKFSLVELSNEELNEIMPKIKSLLAETRTEQRKHVVEEASKKKKKEKKPKKKKKKKDSTEEIED